MLARSLQPVGRVSRIVGSSGRAVLIADDDPAVRRLVAEIVRQAGFSPIQCSNGAEACALGMERSHRLLCLDWDMPLLAGPDALARLRQAGVRDPALLISGRAECDEDLIALLGPMCYLRKPFALSEIRTSMQALLRPAKPFGMERREFPRVPAVGSTLIQPKADDEHLGIVDVSQGGIGIRSTRAVAVGEKLTFTIAHRRLQEALQREGRVQWAMQPPSVHPVLRIGLAFG